ncbi:MAG: hypothetical protein AB7F99_07265 [Vicinamibacterales bacterium]
MTPIAALRDGVSRVVRAPAILAGLWLATFLIAIGPALMVRDSIAGHLGASLEGERSTEAVNYDWLQEFMSQAQGPAASLTPAVLGFAAVLDNASAMFDGRRRPLVVTIASAMAVGVWLFLSGGIIDRYARLRPLGAHAFFAASGGFFVRFLRLGAIAAIVYAWLFLGVHPALGDVQVTLTADATSERTVVLVRAAVEVPFVLAVAAVHVLFDYARVRAVVEDRRSMLAALAAALRFISANPGAVAAVYVGNVLLLGIIISAYALAAPGAGDTGLVMWATFFIGQAYIVARTGARLAFWGSATALFQSRLAHAGYVATPVPAWPDSATVEAIRRA